MARAHTPHIVLSLPSPVPTGDMFKHRLCSLQNKNGLFDHLIRRCENVAKNDQDYADIHIRFLCTMKGAKHLILLTLLIPIEPTNQL